MLVVRGNRHDLRSFVLRAGSSEHIIHARNPDAMIMQHILVLQFLKGQANEAAASGANNLLGSGLHRENATVGLSVPAISLPSSLHVKNATFLLAVASYAGCAAGR